MLMTNGGRTRRREDGLNGWFLESIVDVVSFLLSFFVNEWVMCCFLRYRWFFESRQSSVFISSSLQEERKRQRRKHLKAHRDESFFSSSSSSTFSQACPLSLFLIKHHVKKVRTEHFLLSFCLSFFFPSTNFTGLTLLLLVMSIWTCRLYSRAKSRFSKSNLLILNTARIFRCFAFLLSFSCFLSKSLNPAFSIVSLVFGLSPREVCFFGRKASSCKSHSILFFLTSQLKWRARSSSFSSFFLRLLQLVIALFVSAFLQVSLFLSIEHLPWVKESLAKQVLAR